MEERDAAFAVLRRENPVPWSRPAESDLLPPEENTRGFWSLTKYKDIQFASRNPADLLLGGRDHDGGLLPGDDRGRAVVHRDGRPAPRPAARHHDGRLQARQHAPPGGLGRRPRPRPRGRDGPAGRGRLRRARSVQLPGTDLRRASSACRRGETHDRTIAAAQRLLSWTDPEVKGDLTGLELFGGAVLELREVAAMLAEERRSDARRRPHDLDRPGGVGGREDDRRRDLRVLRAARRRRERHDAPRLRERDQRPVPAPRSARSPGRGRPRARRRRRRGGPALGLAAHAHAPHRDART